MIDMEIRELEVFLAVMSAGSITGAARLLDRSQSQVTRLIQDLETSLGFALFDRNGPRITPTDKGIAFHTDAERFLSGIGHLRERAKTIARKEPEPVEIAATSAFASGIIPLALAELPEKLLPHTIYLRSMPAEAAVQSVLARTADFCVTSLPADQPGLEAHGFFQGRCVAAVAPDDPLAAKKVIAISDLAGRTLITMANPFRLRRRIDQALELANVNAGRIIATSAAMNAVQIASTGLGVAIIEPATAYGLQMANVEVRPLDVDIPFLWAIFSAASRPLSETSRELIQLIIRIASARMPVFIAHDPKQIGRVADMTYGGGFNGETSPVEPFRGV
ncbi:LysR family transcriptional regulator [Agrobacterium rubi]|uniref:LysR family transcriptional regulator n=1 Tax=Agrobacterium rubi TaxID=28099 RepID=A0AAE7US25_9HYPH|nr:LysR family transcriptional regulator [Agrobacterium rubi]NTE88124.1 LysR family transcriptional regulator [Agrobacterium rubi]NTF03891.1 LysR family transcriptional regulator [Agrobacterium rubi]NTF38218.1 LysR family transcriptional regulator [Agrobacterium rubi]OCJ43715.1 LysR family transcriptional regulator [Agrobacterium rubi]QTG01886.1 LysR family transcriptional regulator [Agrobacterium rubi]